MQTGLRAPLATQTATLLMFFGASLLASWGLALGLHQAGLFPELESRNAQRTAHELAIRFTLVCFLGAAYAAILLDSAKRARIFAPRWRRTLLIVFGLGAASALADPFHPVSAEGNWIRYWTAGGLLTAGTLALLHATRSTHPTLDRLFGATFGPLLVLAGADEVLQLHESLEPFMAAARPLGDSVPANDVATLAVAVAGVCVLVALLALRASRFPLGALLREPRYRLPARLFALAVLTFGVAMLLDSFDAQLESLVDAVGARLSSPDAGGLPWSAVWDVGEFANAIEELFELAASAALLVMIGSLYSIRALAGRTPPDRQPAGPLAG
jgi:hypothetical protein